jgi:UDP-N-acetylglucosamine 2-epimerase (non-hydrolysing)
VTGIKILHIVGNRPQFIKLAPMLRALRPYKQIKNVIVHSGQHYDFKMSQIFFDQLELPSPHYNLAVGSGTHGVQTGKILAKLDPVLLKEQPSLVLVYGDTNTTLAGSLAANKFRFPLGHVEAGLRENVWRPEEINRKLSDHCSDLLFCPTRTAVKSLRREGLPSERVFLTGDITYDAFLWTIRKRVENQPLPDYFARGKSHILLTLHRAETVDYKDVFHEILLAMIELKERILFPAHPRTIKQLKKFGYMKIINKSDNILLLPAVGYFEFLRMVLAAKLIITDSGGVIKEAFYAKKPCVTLDSTTEYIEILESGANIWAGKKKKAILDAVEKIKRFNPSSIRPERIFGDGQAACKMVSLILDYFKFPKRISPC